MSVGQDTREDKANRIDRIKIYLVKLIVLCAVGLIATWLSRDLFSISISTLTFTATVLIDSIINSNKCKSLNLSLFTRTLSLVSLLSAIIVMSGTVFLLAWSHKGNTFIGCEILATLIIIYLAVLEIVIECIIAIRTKD